MSQLIVTNRDEQDLHVTYAFKTYSFPVGKPVVVDEELARFVFGWDEADLLPALVRLGFVRLSTEIEQAKARLDKYQIVAAPAQQDRSVPSAVDVAPHLAARRVGVRQPPMRPA